METTLIHQLESRGYRARAVPIGHLDDLRETIEGIHMQGLLDEELYQECLADFAFTPPEDVPGARSLIVVAFPDPQVRFTFNWGGHDVPVVVPPTYLHWRRNDQQVEKALAELLEPEGYRVAQAVVPKKLLAVCSGLAAYGLNSITYVENLGSFHRLAAFCSDLGCERDQWREASVMERCGQCLRCARSCPTGAIEPERHLPRAERCITFRNEKPGQVAFPQWVESSWHDSLVGCMHCQRVCPENRGVLEWYEEGARFSEEETRLLLTGVPAAELPAALAEKLGRWDLLELLDLLPRNLAVLLEKGRLHSAR